MNDLADVMECHVTRDECGDTCIKGSAGNIHEDGSGYSLAVMLDTCRQWTSAKVRLGFCKLRQDGDTEGVLHLAQMPTPEQAATIRELLGIRKRRTVSPAEAERLRCIGFKARHNQAPPAVETRIDGSGACAGG